MSIIARLIAKFRKQPPPIIMSAYGPVTESARRQAALNMRDDPILREAVIARLCVEMNSNEEGLREARRRYPEAFEED
jgi:hypothetical protein